MDEISQSNHICKSGKTVVLQLIPVALQHGCFPIQMFSHLEQLFETYLIESSNNSPEILKDLVLNIKPSDQILSNVLDICKNTAYISFGGLQSNFEKISTFIDRS